MSLLTAARLSSTDPTWGVRKPSSCTVTCAPTQRKRRRRLQAPFGICLVTSCAAAVRGRARCRIKTSASTCPCRWDPPASPSCRVVQGGAAVALVKGGPVSPSRCVECWVARCWTPSCRLRPLCSEPWLRSRSSVGSRLWASPEGASHQLARAQPRGPVSDDARVRWRGSPHGGVPMGAQGGCRTGRVQGQTVAAGVVPGTCPTHEHPLHRISHGRAVD